MKLIWVKLSIGEANRLNGFNLAKMYRIKYEDKIMGLFDFVTNAGSKLGEKIFEVTHKDETAEITKTTSVSPERLNELRTKSITDNIEESGVIVQGLNVTVDGEKVTLAGRVNTQECCEKITLVAGNQHGVGCVDCQLEVANPEPESTFYTVQSGDTLGKIAKEQYGDASKYMTIFEANKPLLTDPNKIYVGQNLRIPAL